MKSGPQPHDEYPLHYGLLQAEREDPLATIAYALGVQAQRQRPSRC